ncbi:MAG: S8 family serine peptidase [Deltaproteobacteria bacterium]|nr:S8 family serine peptidase [Deltaproteobacteria bacterium]
MKHFQHCLAACLAGIFLTGCGEPGATVVAPDDPVLLVPETAEGRIPVLIHDEGKTEPTRSARKGLDAGKAGNVRHFDRIGVTAADLDPDEYERLVARFGPERVQRQQYYRPTLAQSLELAGNSLFFSGSGSDPFSGQGTIVAVLDTPLGNIDSGRFGPCLGGAGSGTCRIAEVSHDCGDGTAANDVVEGHGRNVTGIVLGVANDTRILFYDIFSPSTTSGRNLTNDAAIACALNDIATRRAAGSPIIAANLSLGGAAGSFTGACSTSATSVALRTLVNTHRVMPVIAAGNEGLSNGLSHPGCVPWATSVGAVYDAALEGGTSFSLCSDEIAEADQITCFTNIHGELDLMAPGFPITAAGISMGGTSQATPHVAGAAARMASLLGGGWLPGRATSYLRMNGLPASIERESVWNGYSIPRLELMLDSASNPPAAAGYRSYLDGEGTAGLAIPDSGSVTSEIVIPASACTGNAGAVRVDMDILHPARGELTLKLRRNSDADQLIDTIIGTDVRFGVRQIFSIADFGGTCSGTWTLTVEDTAAGNTGALLEWSLFIHDTGSTGNISGSITSAPQAVATGGGITVQFDRTVSANAVPATVNALYLRQSGRPLAPLVLIDDETDTGTAVNTYNRSLSGNAPATPGVYDIIIRLDDRQEAAEPQGESGTGEEDNELVGSTPLLVTHTDGADFIAAAGSVTSSATLTDSMTVTGTYRIANIGNAAADLAVQFCFVGTGIRQGTTVCHPVPDTASDFAAATLGATGNFSFTLPGGVSTGSWFLEIRPSADGGDTDSNLANNNYRVPVLLGFAMPDLAAEIITLDTQLSDLSLRLDYQYRNNGSQTAAAHQIRVVASLDTVFGNSDDQVLATENVAALPGATTRASAITADPPTLPAGTDKALVYIALVLDPGGSVSESSESNNRIQTALVFARDTGDGSGGGGGGGCSTCGTGGGGGGGCAGGGSWPGVLGLMVLVSFLVRRRPLRTSRALR